MIDIENDIYTPIAAALRSKFPAINVSGEYVREPSQFPHVTIIEQDNYVTPAHLDSSDTEKFATIMFEVNVYSNKTVGKKTECKSILSVIDSMMFARNLVRTSRTPVPNMENATIYRLTARYEAETDGKMIYRR